MDITVIRHTSVDVPQGICYGQSNVEVSKNFELEANIIKQTIAKHNYNIVYCSPLSRCVKLSQFCGFSSPIFDNRLMELNFGAWEMHDWNKISDPQLQKWFNNWLFEKPTNGESFFEMQTRVNSFIVELQNQTNTSKALIFTHAGVIRCFEAYLNKIPIEKIFDLEINYGAVFNYSI